jgi:2-polyprenyl-3-methyl-5-hydroxy-6-metoxy-1,4-benzoquinol methylase
MKQQIQESNLNQALEKMLADIGAAMSASLVVIGDKLGLYKTLSVGGAMTPSELAGATGTHERYVREWLNNQAAGGYVTYNPKDRTFYLTPEQAALLADETSAYFMPGAFEVIASTARDEPRIEQRFRTGGGLAWGEHDPGLFTGTERFFGPNYAAHLVSQWIPSLDGVENRLKKGIEVADVGCGHGVSTILMAQAYPNSRFTGYDYHEPSVRVARMKAKSAGVESRARFEVAKAEEYPGTYDFVTSFDCLHDMSDPLGAARHTRETLRDDGTWMIVEPRAGDNVAENLNPVGRVYYAASTMVCVPCSLAGKGPALGAQAGESKIRDVVTRGGFQSFRRAAETPFNMVLEARP